MKLLLLLVQHLLMKRKNIRITTKSLLSKEELNIIESILSDS